MTKIYRTLFYGVFPILGLVAGAYWYQRTSDIAIQYEKNFVVLKNACQDSAGPAGKTKDHGPYIENVCGCFAKAALKHRNISVASVVGDAQIVHSILKDCSQRVPSSNKSK